MVLLVLLPLAVVFHGRTPRYALPESGTQIDALSVSESPDWIAVTRIGRLISRVPHARIVFPTALILSVWLLTIVIAYGRDIYFQNRDKKVEAKLFDELVNRSRVGYCSSDAESRVEECNTALADMLGLARSAVVGMSLHDLGLDPDLLVPGDVTFGLINCHDESRLPVLIAAMEGDEETGLQVIVAPLPGDEVGVDSMPDMHARGARKDQLKRDFLRSLNHELRTPLTVILGSASILESDVSAGNADLVDAIKVGGERLLHVLEAMMLLSELEASSQDAGTGAVEIGAVVREAAAEFAGPARDKGLAFDVVVPEELIFASADPRGVRQIIGQLIDNAIKFTDEGGVELVAARTVSSVYFSVRDTGRGIEPSVLEIAATDFRETPLSGRATTGIGLGLARLIAERMHGRLELESKPGVGTRVDVYLRDASRAANSEATDPIAA